jgi:hypothetical protein
MPVEACTSKISTLTLDERIPWSMKDMAELFLGAVHRKASRLYLCIRARPASAVIDLLNVHHPTINSSLEEDTLVTIMSECTCSPEMATSLTLGTFSWPLILPQLEPTATQYATYFVGNKRPRI